MERVVASSQLFRFGLFEADPVHNTLTCKGLRVKIQDQPFRALILLLERAGEIISREEFQQKLWPEGTYVDFDGGLNVVLKKLRAAIDDDSDNPRFIETVPRRGYRFIAPVSVCGSLPQPVSSSTVDAASLAPVPVTVPAGRRPHHLIYGGAALALVLVAAGTWLVLHRTKSFPKSTTSVQAAAPVPMRRSVAVLGFHNVSGKSADAWLSTAFSEMLSTELAAGERLRLVSGEEVANLRLSSPWPQADTLDQKTTSRIGSALNSDLVVLGSYTIVGPADRGRLRIDVRMQDSRTGEILTEIAEIGGSADLFQLVSRVGDRLRDRLGIPGLEPQDSAAALAFSPMDPEGGRFYALGAAKMREYDWLAAKDLLEQASKADPKFSMIHLMLAQCWARLGYGQRSKDESKKALELSSGLPPVQRLLVEGNYYESLADHERAVSTYRALFQLFPDSVDYGLLLATAQNAAGHARQASSTLTQLRSLPPPASDDPRIDLNDARATAQNDPDRLVFIRSAISKASAQGKKLLYAQARKEECLNLIYSDKPTQGLPSCEEAYNIFMAAGNHLEAADSVRMMGDYQGSQGHLEVAIATYERALKILEQLGEHLKTGSVLNNMAIDYTNLGKVDRAEQLYRQAKVHFEQAGDRSLTALAIGNIADILYVRGDLHGATKMYEQALEIESSLEHGSPGYLLYRMADVELAQGNLHEAHLHAQQAIDAIRPNQGAYQYLTGAMTILADVLKTEGDLQGARHEFEEVLALRKKVGQAELAAETQLDLADLSVDDGHLDLAEPLVRPAIAEFEKEKADPDIASAYIVLSRVLLSQGKMDDAQKVSKHAVELTLTTADPSLKLPAAIQHARVAMAGATRSSSAEQELRSAIASAKRLGYYGIELEARLALAEWDLKINPDRGRLQLDSLATETSNHGFELLARRAQQAIASTGTTVAARKLPN
jgi:DNA-binding winged helix-turn-helix (wHTH) protein/tetratricopeptide (TPR) repeat protein/TolB-like protein